MQARALAVWFVVASAAAAQEVRMAEALPVDAAYRVNCRVKIAGKLKLPDKAALDVEGESVIEYDERVLAVGPSSDVERAIRWVERMDFARKVGGEAQRASLRPVARRLVILRAGNLEVPFSPDGPLTWSEIDLVRTDVFTPALAGLLPRGAVRVGDTWQATETAARELTDLGKITNGGLTCRLERVDRALGPATAKVTVSGTIRGVGENGPTQHTLDGFYYFDLDGQKLRYVSLKGTESLLDAQGQPQGEVTGTFVLTRDPATAPRTIAADVAGQRLEPTDANTELLFEDDDLGIRFQHGRR